MSDISKIFPGSEKKFEAATGAGGVVRKHIFENSITETTWIVDDIQEKIASGIPPESIAIITKKNKSLEAIAK